MNLAEAHRLYVATIDKAIWLRVRRIADRVSAGEIDVAIATALEINDQLKSSFRCGALTYDEATERERAVRASLLGTIGEVNTLIVFLGEYDARAARGDDMPAGRERVAELLRARMPSC